MVNYDINHIKNIVLVGHTGSGKTTLAEAMAFSSGSLKRCGTIDGKNTISDYTDIEHEKGKSFFAKLIKTNWEGYKINVLDTPGSDDFVGEILGAMRVADCGVMLLNASTGVEVGTDMIWDYTADYKLPMLIAVNQLDHEFADFEQTVASAISHFGKKVVVVQYPINQGENFNGFIDILNMKMYQYDVNGNQLKILDIPQSELEKANQLHQELVESIASNDESLMDLFFEKGELNEVEMKQGLHSALIHHDLFPVFCLAAQKQMGVDRLMGFIDHVCPSAYEMPKQQTVNGDFINCSSDAPTSLFIFKTLSEPHVGDLSFFKVLSGVVKVGDELTNENTDQVERFNQLFEMEGNHRIPVNALVAGDIGATLKLKNTHTNNTLHTKGYPVELPPIHYPDSIMTMAIESLVKGEEDKLSQALHQLVEEDPTIRVEVSPIVKQTLLHCQGEMHLAVIQWKLIHVHKLHVTFKSPKVPYRETIRKATEVVYRHKKQTGGAGQFAEIAMKIEPWFEGMNEPLGYPIRGVETISLAWGGKLVYYNCIVGGAIDARFHPSILKGILEKMQQGTLIGSSISDVRVIVFDGKMHPVDSNDLAFKTAGMMAFKEAFQQADPLVMEPYYHLDIKTPESLTGALMGLLQSHRGSVEGMDAEGYFTQIEAHVPYAEMNHLSSEIRSVSKGRAKYTLRFDHYEAVPYDIQLKLVNAMTKEEELV